jgi:hypothetical protein
MKGEIEERLFNAGKLGAPPLRYFTRNQESTIPVPLG